MKSIREAFKFRRQEPRIAVQWLVDVQVRDAEHFLGFYTQDMSLTGVCLLGQAPDAVERVRTSSRVSMRLRLPGTQGFVEFEGQFKWERQENGKTLSGWAFTRISRKARKALNDYIAAHPEDLIQGPEDA